MTFLAPAALFGVLLLTIPVLVHLFKPRKMRRAPFSSLRWLKETRQRLSRRIQWHQWLLFLMRAGVVLFLVLALARPLLGLGDDRPTDRFVVLDVGAIMAHGADLEKAPIKKARDLAEVLLERAPPGDRSALVFAGTRPRLAGPPAVDPALALAGLRAVKPEAGDGPVSAALPIIGPFLPSNDSGRDVELVFLTSNLQSGWRQNEVQAFLKGLPVKPHVKVVDFGPGPAQNGWIASARLLDPGNGSDRFIRVEMGGVGGRQERTLRLKGAPGIKEETLPVTIIPGQANRAVIRVPSGVNLEGQGTELRLEPPDPFPEDDRWFLALDGAWSIRALVLQPGTVDELGGSGRYLKAGMEELAQAKHQAVKVTLQTAASSSPADIQKADVIFLAGVPELGQAVLESLEARARAGAGLVVFLGPGLNAEFYNQKLYHPLQPAGGLLPLALKPGPGGLKTGRPGAWTGARWSHPVLVGLDDPVLGDLAGADFRVYSTFDGKPGKGDSVLAWFEGDVPALIDRPLGLGRVLFWNASADDAWGDLAPRRRAWVPLLDRMLTYLSGGLGRRQFTVGVPLALPLPGWKTGESATIVGPDGEAVPSRIIAAGGQSLLHMDGLTEPGLYRVRRSSLPGKRLSFAVNSGRGSSPLFPMAAEILKSWWAPTEVEILTPEAFSAALEESSAVWPFWPVLILAAGLLLLAETIYVYRLVPKLLPRVAASVVPGRGLLRPSVETPSK